jgi:GTP-binding protein Era
MMNFVFSSLETADLLCLLIDATEKYGHGDEFVIETLKKVTTPIFLLINKADAVRKDRILPLIDKYKDLLDFKEIIPISALKGDNLEVLEKVIYERLPEAEKLYSDDEITDQSEIFLIAEIIREKILNYVTEELPFVTAVYIEEIRRPKEGGEEPEAEGKEQDIKKPLSAPEPQTAGSQDARESGRKENEPRRPVTYIRASIFVEKDNHRKIVIGRQGKLIKTVGIEARREIEEILGTKVFLELHVRVKPRWRDSEDVLDLIEGQKG